MAKLNSINHEAWLKNAMTFIAEKGLEQDFTDWCGGWRCPVQPKEPHPLSDK
jgi:hypothetical protein